MTTLLTILTAWLAADAVFVILWCYVKGGRER